MTVDSEKSAHADIEYIGHTVVASERENAIINVLRYHNASRSIVFCGTRENVKHLTSRLANRGFSTVALSGEFTQAERSHALQSIRDGRAKVCVATDVAARGIDLPELDLVIHADLPTNPETLLHRSGRTGRAGRKGVCTLIVTSNRRRNAERLVRFAKVGISWKGAPNASDIANLDNERIRQSPFLTDTLEVDEQKFAHALLETHSAEQIAAAFYRLSRSALPAAEDLSEVAEQQQKQASLRSDFENGQWFSISAGRNQRAEPRWLLPVICRSGDIDRNSVGAISIRETETLFEIHPDKVDAYKQLVSEQGCVERALTIKFVGSSPDKAGGGRPGGGYKGGKSDGPSRPRNKNKQRRPGDFSSNKPRSPQDPAEKKFAKRKKDKGKASGGKPKSRKAPDKA